MGGATHTAAIYVKEWMEGFKAAQVVSKPCRAFGMKTIEKLISLGVVPRTTTQEHILETIASVYKGTAEKYIIDPHTAVGVFHYLKEDTYAHVPAVCMACAHPAKFGETVARALD